MSEGYKKTYTSKKYGNSITITREMLEDGRFSDQLDIAKELGLAAARKKEQDAADVLNHGFTTVTTPDGLPLFSNAHILKNSATTFDNLSTTVFSQAGLEEADRAMRNQYDNDGNRLRYLKFNTIVISPDQMFESDRILNSELQSNITENAKNAVKGKYRVIVWPYLDSAGTYTNTPWFALDDLIQSLTYVTRRPLEFGKDTDINRQTMTWYCDERYDFGVTSPVGIVGFKP
jgi:phage major head subunit gpT-like protein